MLIGILLVIACGLMWSSVGILSSTIARKGYDFLGIRIRVTSVATLIGWVCFPRWTELPSVNLGEHLDLALLLIPAAMIGGLGIFLINQAMRRGHNGACWTLSQSAMIVPFVISLLFWGEALTLGKTLGILLSLGAIISFGKDQQGQPHSDEAFRIGWFPLAALAFFCLGVQQTLMILPSRYESLADPLALRTPLLLTGIYFINQLLYWIQGGHPGKRPLPMMLYWCCIAVCSQGIIFLGIDRLEAHNAAGIAFPIAISACVLGFALYSLLILRENSSLLQKAGMCCGVVGIVVMSFF